MPSCRTSVVEKRRRSSVGACSQYVMETPVAGRVALRFASGHGIVSDVVRDVAEFLARDGLRTSAIDDATIALAEALNNIEEHAYAGRRGLPVLIDVELDAARASFRIEDRGHPMPRESLPNDDMPATDPSSHEKWPEGGFGWALMHRLTSDLSYRRAGEWNQLRFTVS